MRLFFFALFPLTLLLGLLGGCGGLQTKTTADASVVMQGATGDIVTLSLTRNGESILTSSNICHSISIQPWCSAVNTGAEQRINFTMDQLNNPVKVWATNKSSVDRSVTVRVIIAGSERLSRTVSIPAGMSLEVASMS